MVQPQHCSEARFGYFGPSHDLSIPGR
jgi:hypothetical protein